MDHDLEASIKTLCDGFSALADEYRNLAQQHELLEQRLADATLQIENARRLHPESYPIDVKDIGSDEPKLTLSRNLDAWLAHLADRGVIKDRNLLNPIHDAQLAKFRLHNRSRPDTSVTNKAEKIAMNGTRVQARTMSQPPILEEIPMERDFTVVRNPGELGCPFSIMRGKKSADYLSVGKSMHDLPTPQRSGSFVSNGRHSKRTSFVDPLKPDVNQEPPSPAESIIESSGLACPIRFLEQHSPEELAKYFEEHKHELPRSHESCVKRFQSDDSKREIDAKYGNLVTMIQGLGKKHKSLLPEVPDPENVRESNEDQQNNRRVKKWAATIGEPANVEDGTTRNGSGPDEHIAASDRAEEDRVSRFERPLVEVRLGESPSRPWGVAIPPKYFERDDISEASSSPVALAANVSPLKNQDSLPRAQDDRVLAAIKASRSNIAPVAAISSREALPADTDKPEPKCPFHHRALISRHRPSSVKAEQDSRGPAHDPSASHTVHEDHISNSTRGSPKFVNRGIMVVADGSHLSLEGLDNTGVLIVGYDATGASMLVKSASESRGGR